MILLAIDPSLSSTGFAVFDEDGKLIEYGKQTTGNKIIEEDRICKIANKIKTLIEKYKIEVVVMETQFFSKNAKTSMQLSRLRGAITYVCRGLNVDMKYLTPAEARKLQYPESLWRYCSALSTDRGWVPCCVFLRCFSVLLRCLPQQGLSAKTLWQR